MSAKEKEGPGNPPALVIDGDVFKRMAGGYAGPDRRQGHQLREIVADEVIKLLLAILRQVKDQAVFQPRPLSDTAQAAVAAYENNRLSLAHEHQ